MDGKASEWNNQLQAYNHATDIYYTLANNDEWLYLTVQATDPDIINKIYNAGLMFTIGKAAKKLDNNCVSVTYPIFDAKNKFHVAISHKPIMDPAQPTTIAKADSFMNAANKSLAEKAKTIRTGGIPGLDTLISVYNEDGIKAASLFDNKMAYTIEIAIRLTLLNLTPNTAEKFYYHIQLNPLRGYQNMDNVTVTYRTAPNGRTIPTVDLGKMDINHLMSNASVTDFWGEYVMAGK